MDIKNLPVRLAFFINDDYEVSRATVVRNNDGVYDLDEVKSLINGFVSWLFEGQDKKAGINREFEIINFDVKVKNNSFAPVKVITVKTGTGVFDIKVELEVIQDVTSWVNEKFGYKMFIQEIVDTLGL